MNNINPHIFPLMPNKFSVGASLDEKKPNACSRESVNECYIGIKGSKIHAALAQKVHVRPKTNLVEDYECAYLGPEENRAEILNLPEASQETIHDTSKALTAIKVKDQLTSNVKGRDFDYPKVTFLGTGSSVPSKYRNVSAILIENLPGRFIILDCGEGTVLQLHRMFGRKGALRILRNLTAVYISHLHADHHLGLITIIKERQKAFEDIEAPVEMLYLLAPSRISVFLCLYHAKFEDILTDVCQIRNEHLLPFIPPNPNDAQQDKLRCPPSNTKTRSRDNRDPIFEKNPYSNQAIDVKGKIVTTQKLYPQILDPLLKTIGLKSVKTCRALHCPGAFCVSFWFDYAEEGREFKLVYTGDTRPTDQLDQLATTADLLIHEATLEHYMLYDCKIKKHSTFTEAVECAKDANAKFTILTHFSQRYPKFPFFEEFENEENVGCAWDLMTVSPKTFKYIKPCYPAVYARFPEDLSEMKAKKEQYVHTTEATSEERITKNLGIETDTVTYNAGPKRFKKRIVDAKTNT
jgi:ribonuclease Z